MTVCKKLGENGNEFLRNCFKAVGNMINMINFKNNQLSNEKGNNTNTNDKQQLQKKEATPEKKSPVGSANQVISIVINNGSKNDKSGIIQQQTTVRVTPTTTTLPLQINATALAGGGVWTVPIWWSHQKLVFQCIPGHFLPMIVWAHVGC